MTNDLDIIKKLEEKYKIELNELDLEFDEVFGDTNGYALDENKNVTGLNLWNLGLPDISGIEGLKHLTQLDLNSNLLPDISPLKELKHLTHLYLSSNQLSDISTLGELTGLTDLRLYNNRITDISPLKKLNGLTLLNLNSNQLSDISHLKELTHLTTLHLKDNQIEDISCLEKLNGLTILNLSANRLTGTSTLKELKNLTYLYLSSNQLTGIPGLEQLTNLAALHLDDNQLTDVSRLEALTNLTTLDLKGNRLSDISRLKELKKLFHLDLGSNQLTRFSGFSGLKNLIQLDLRSNQIDDISGLLEFRGLVRLYLMDNRITHAPAGILQLDMSIKWELDIESGIFFEGNPLQSPPVEITAQGTRAAANYFDELGPETGPLPRSWLAVREQLEGLKKDYISLDDYLKICGTHGLTPEGAEFLSGYLHDLGVILHYRRDKLLKEIVILDPGWETEAVSTLLQSGEIRENNGRFTFEQLKKYWDLKKFPEDTHAPLIRLLETFELCYYSRRTGCYVLPELLPPGPPPVQPEEYKTGKVLHFEYHYPSMPAGIIGRFVARNYYFFNNEHCTPNAAELEFGDARALVICEPGNQKMKIFISGARQNELRQFIRIEFQHIHKSLALQEGKDYFKMLPCTCRACVNAPEPHLYKYETLREVTFTGIPVTRCPIGEEDVAVNEIVEPIEGEVPEKGLVGFMRTAASHLRRIAPLIGEDEESRNRFIRSLLPVFRFRVEDHPWGWVSPGSTDSAGFPPDIKILDIEGHPLGVVEAFTLKNFDRDKIHLNLERLFHHKTGRRENSFVVVYVENGDFSVLWKRYLDYLPGIDFLYPLSGSIKEEETRDEQVKSARAVHLRNGKRTEVYHLFINMKHRL